MYSAAKTVAAISTPPGKGGVAVIRISGDEAFDIVGRVFFPRSGRCVSGLSPRRAVYGDIVRYGERIDDGILTLFPAPNSYTGEDVAEISCHGGILITRMVLEAVLSAGAIQASAGEFTQRAFINGRLTLTDAEGIGMLLDAETEEQVRLSSDSARSALRTETEKLRAALTSLLGDIYARIDYPDEELGDMSDGEIDAALTEIIRRADALLSTYPTGHAVSSGIETVICGKPNVGKSSLYNLLCGEDAAIVTDIEGTTRDVLSQNIQAGPIILRLSDTAGIHEVDAESGGDRKIERIGIEKSRKKIDGAELILALFDTSRPLSHEDRELISYLRTARAKKIALLTKSDIRSDEFGESAEREIRAEFPQVISISMSENAGKSVHAPGVNGEPRNAGAENPALTELKEAIEGMFLNGEIRIGEDAVIYSARQRAYMAQARGHAECALDALRRGIPQDAISSDIELALSAIGELDGKAVSEEVVNDIFSRFCVGK